MLITALVLMTAILVVATNSALYSSAAQHHMGNWTDRQQTLALANATVKLAQSNLTTLLAGVSSNAAVPTAIAGAGAGYYSSLIAAPTWSPWPAAAAVIAATPISGMPAASYYVIYTGSVTAPGGSMGNNGSGLNGTVKHQFLILVNAPGIRSGSDVIVESSFSYSLPS